MTLEAGPEIIGFTSQVLAAGLDDFFKLLTVENLENLLWQELGHTERLDNFHANERGWGSQFSALAQGPQLLAHIAPGSLPVPVLMEMVLGLLARSAQFVKCASGRAFVPRMFAHSLYDADRKVGACIELADWKGGWNQFADTALFAECDCVVATGSDQTLAAIAGRISPKTRFIGYGTRLSFGYVTREALRQGMAVAKRAAADVVAWNQCGCLSPHVIYVEDGATVSREAFADMLALELKALEATHPRGPLGVSEAADIARRRSFYEVRAAHLPTPKCGQAKNRRRGRSFRERSPNFKLPA